MGTRPGRFPHRSSSPLLDRECSPPHRRHPGCEPTIALALSGACVADIAPCTPNPASSVIMSAVFANRATSSISLSGPAPGQAPHPVSAHEIRFWHGKREAVTARDSGAVEDAAAEQVELGSAEHGPFEHFDPIYLPLNRS